MTTNTKPKKNLLGATDFSGSEASKLVTHVVMFWAHSLSSYPAPPAPASPAIALNCTELFLLLGSISFKLVRKYLIIDTT